MANAVSSVRRSAPVDHVQQPHKSSETEKKAHASKNPSSLANQDKVTLSKHHGAEQNRHQS
jgi:hypothetical protein